MILKEKILFSKEECQSIIWGKTNNITDWDMNDRKYYSKSINYDDNTQWLFERDRRLYGIGVLLNDDFKGGDFKLYNPDEVKLNKVIGNTYIFDVKIDHEITPIIEGERYSLLWFLQNTDIKVNKEKLI